MQTVGSRVVVAPVEIPFGPVHVTEEFIVRGRI